MQTRPVTNPILALAPGACGDLRFASLLGREGWNRLPARVQRRFARHLCDGASVSYTGTIIHCRMSRAGQLLAQAARLIGAPLPLDRAVGGAAVVTVTEDHRGGGQIWTRVYARQHHFPQVIHSAKRFAGATGLEEYLGAGFGIALSIAASTDGIRFCSDHYFWRTGAYRVRLPRWCAPGQLTIDHADRGQGAFTFTLDLDHPLLGNLIHQVGLFHDHPAQEQDQ